MSLAIITTTNEGNILAADSMETYRNAIGDIREGSQTRMKLYQVNSRIGAVSSGLSFLENKNMHQHILLFKKQYNLENKTVKVIAGKLYDYFLKKYQEYLKATAAKKKKDYENNGNKNVTVSIELECIKVKFKDANGSQEKKFYMPIIEFLIAGHDPDGTNNIYKVTIPDSKDKNGIVLKRTKDQSGATWIGQTDVLIRIIRGWSPQIKRLKTIAEMPSLKKKMLLKEIDDQEYLINWGTMTIQDAVEFATLAIKTTESVQKMTDGTWQFPGSSPGVGGPIDIAVITPEKGFVWIQKKDIEVNGAKIDLDTSPNLRSTPQLTKSK